PWVQVGLKLFSSFIERWRPETRTFHLPCRECIITLEDVQLQLGLPVDGFRSDRYRLVTRHIPEARG
ncbi:hypothetical protein Godav_027845, partial [Gossypium davidsonii]|nr:hypothetical protein [Gossypium davidsonii]